MLRPAGGARGGMGVQREGEELLFFAFSPRLQHLILVNEERQPRRAERRNKRGGLFFFSEITRVHVCRAVIRWLAAIPRL